MNEQILNLAKEYLVRDEHTEWGWQECHKYVFDPEDLEKFVKLIVQECAGIADEPTSQPFNSYGEKIKQHFGVTE